MTVIDKKATLGFDDVEATLHVHGMHSAPILTIDFSREYDKCQEKARAIAQLFNGEILFCDKKQHCVIKTDKECFEKLVLYSITTVL